MDATIGLLDVVALTVDRPEKGLIRGQVGTVVEVLSRGTYEVEFSDDDGRTYAQTALPAEQLMVLHYRPELAAQ
jgi:membrane protein implicated in regulation of membrane protease activity